MSLPFTGRRRHPATAPIDVVPEETPAAGIPGQDLHLAVPAAQVQAQAGTTGPRPAIPPRASGPQPAYAPQPGTHPYPPGDQHPQAGMRDTQEWQPPWARQLSRPGVQPAARHSGPQQAAAPDRLSPVRVPLTPALPHLINATDPQDRIKEAEELAEKVRRTAYPDPALSVGHPAGQADGYAAAMREIDDLTGTSSPYGDPASWPAPVITSVPAMQGTAVTSGEAS